MLSANLCLKIYKFICSKDLTTIKEISTTFDISERYCLKYLKLLKLHNLIIARKLFDSITIKKVVF